MCPCCWRRPPDADPARLDALASAGATTLGTELYDGRIALPELLEDLSARGIATLMVEGGAEVARAFLDEGLVDRIGLFQGPSEIGPGGASSRRSTMGRSTPLSR